MFNAIHRLLRWAIIKLNRPAAKNPDKIVIVPGKFPCNHVAEVRFVDEKGQPNGMVERNNLTTVTQFTPIGSFGPAERHPHPHPRFAKLRVQRQKAVAFSVCSSCSAVEVVFGYNQRDVAPDA